jgi:hypothetical protein
MLGDIRHPPLGQNRQCPGHFDLRPLRQVIEILPGRPDPSLWDASFSTCGHELSDMTTYVQGMLQHRPAIGTIITLPRQAFSGSSQAQSVDRCTSGDHACRAVALMA